MMPSTPAIKTGKIDLTLAQLQQACAAGRLGALWQLVKTVELRKPIRPSDTTV